MNKEKQLLFFYGAGCDKCVDSERIVDTLISEGFNIEKIEVWNNKENYKFLEEVDNGEDECGGIPFFLNQITGSKLCGESSYEKIKSWANEN